MRLILLPLTNALKQIPSYSDNSQANWPGSQPGTYPYHSDPQPTYYNGWDITSAKYAEHYPTLYAQWYQQRFGFPYRAAPEPVTPSDEAYDKVEALLGANPEKPRTKIKKYRTTDERKKAEVRRRERN